MGSDIDLQTFTAFRHHFIVPQPRSCFQGQAQMFSFVTRIFRISEVLSEGHLYLNHKKRKYKLYIFILAGLGHLYLPPDHSFHSSSVFTNSRLVPGSLNPVQLHNGPDRQRDQRKEANVLHNRPTPGAQVHRQHLYLRLHLRTHPPLHRMPLETCLLQIAIQHHRYALHPAHVSLIHHGRGGAHLLGRQGFCGCFVLFIAH